MIERLLLIRPGAIGDFLVSLPALAAIEARYVEVWTAERNVPLARFADAAFSIGSTGLDLLGLPEYDPPRRLLQRLGAFDAIYSWYGANRREFAEAVKGLPFRFFSALPALSEPWIALSEPWIVLSEPRPSGSGPPIHDFYWRQLGHGGECPPPRIDCGDPARENFAVLHAFASQAAKRWSLEKFRELARLLEPHMGVRWCAGPGEGLDGAVRIENLYDLACWIASARVYIGNDSGITHLAAAAGTPTIALFGPTDPAVWAPRGAHVTVLAPLASVTPEDVRRLALQNGRSS